MILSNTYKAYLIAIIGTAAGTIYLPAFPTMGQDFHVLSSLIKHSLTSYFIGYSIGELFSGSLSDTFGRTKILSLFFLIFSFASFICALTEDIYIFIGARGIQGFGAAAGIVLARSLIADSLKGRAYNKTMSALLALAALSPGIAPALGSLILWRERWSFIFLFLASAGLFVVLIGIIPTSKKPKPQINSFKFIQASFLLLSNKIFIYYCLIIGILWSEFYLFLLFSPFIFINNYHWTTNKFALVGILIAVASAVGAFFNRVLIFRFMPKKIIVWGLLFIITISLALVSVEFFGQMTDFSLLTLASLLMMAIGIVGSCAVAEAMKHDLHFNGLASSILGFSKIALSSMVIALGAHLPETTFSLTALLLLISFIALCVFYPLWKAL